MKNKDFMDMGSFDFLDDPKSGDELSVENKNAENTIYYKRKLINIYRRAYSELKLIKLIKEDLKRGYSYHFITAGDVDGLSYLKLILHKIDSLDYALLSTWCMSMEDCCHIHDLLKKGIIKKMDIYVGEIFPTTYAKEFNYLKSFIKKDIGRIAVFRNHSKIWAGYKDDFYFSCEMSCNINTNPRTENANLVISKESFMFYKEYFDKIKSYNLG